MNYRYIAALAALAVPSAVAAQDIQLKLDQTLVENFDGDAVSQAFGPFNATVTPKPAANGAPVYHVAFPGGLNAIATPGNCHDDTAHTGCTGLELEAFFSLPDGKTASDMAATVNAFNATHEATAVVYDQAGQTRINRYIISDFGVTRTNLLIQIYSFRRMAQTWNETLSGKQAAPAPAGN